MPAAPSPIAQQPDQRAALDQAMRQLDAAELQAQPAAMCHALAGVATALLALRDPLSAQAFLNRALRWSAAVAAPDLGADLLCALAEAACLAAEQIEAEQAEGCARAERDRARDHAFEAATLAGRAADPFFEVRLLLRVSDVLERCGDHGDAVQMQTRAMARMGLQASEAGTEGLRLAAPAGLM
ncbi:MAG: hypothetical protein KBC73_19745 [Burkholderiaceae bacterium]|nr:hypothetical protein [Burkholderiaceae bacterium]